MSEKNIALYNVTQHPITQLTCFGFSLILYNFDSLVIHLCLTLNRPFPRIRSNDQEHSLQVEIGVDKNTVNV
jgi:hypothetical protein